MKEKQKKIASLVLAAGLVTMMVSGCSLMPQEEEALAPPLIQSSDIQYTTEPAVKGSISDVVSDSCTAVAASQYNLSFGSHGGYLKTKNFLSGDYVNQGDVLATLDSGDLETSLQNAKIELEILELDLQRALENPPENGKTNYDAERVRLQIQQHNLTIANLEKQLSEATIVAPISGVITFVADLNIGDYAEAKKTLFTVADTSKVEYSYTGTKVSKLSVGMDCTVTIDGVDYPGKISMSQATAPKEFADQMKDTVRISVSGAPTLDIGSKATFQCTVNTKEDVVIVPKNAVTGYSGDYYVYVLEDGLKTERSVEIGISTATQTEIVSGISEGDQVIVK